MSAKMNNLGLRMEHGMAYVVESNCPALLQGELRAVNTFRNFKPISSASRSRRGELVSVRLATRISIVFAAGLQLIDKWGSKVASSISQLLSITRVPTWVL